MWSGRGAVASPSGEVGWGPGTSAPVESTGAIAVLSAPETGIAGGGTRSPGGSGSGRVRSTRSASAEGTVSASADAGDPAGFGAAGFGLGWDAVLVLGMAFR